VSGGGELVTNNNSGSSVISVTQLFYDLTVTKVAQGSSFQQGGTVTYQITVTNGGNAPTSGTISLSDTIPTGLTVTSVSGTNWTCTNAQPVTCTRATSLAAGTSSVITLNANIAANAPGSITNVATVAVAGEFNSGNNTGASVISVTPVAPDLTVTKVAPGGPFQQGGTVTYLITVTNGGNGSTSGTITMSDTIPTGLTVTSVSGANWTCTNAQPVTCTRATSLAAGASSVITLVANIAANAASTIVNTATVVVAGESNSGNNANSSVISVTPVAPDLTVTKVAQGAPFQQGGTVSYLITVTNAGNGPTTGTISLSDTIPTGLTVTSVSGTNWTCTNAQPVTCSRTTPLAAGTSSVITLNANIAANAAASITNTATVVVAGESNAGNNSGSAVISVAPSGFPVLLSVASRKLHNGVNYAMPVDFRQAVDGAISIEPRSGAGGHTLVLHFNTTISLVNAAVSVEDANRNPVGNGTAAAVNGDVLVSLSNIPDRQRIIIGVSGINGGLTENFAMGFMRGDVNGSGSVGAADISAIKARSGQAVTALTYLLDLNNSGTINAADIAAVKTRPATPLP